MNPFRCGLIAFGIGVFTVMVFDIGIGLLVGGAIYLGLRVFGV
jgi:hypothetical protein